MLVHEGASRSIKIDLLLASMLAFVAGGANSAGFLAFGFFSANMTGNVSMVSDYLTMQSLNLAAAFFVIVAMFIFGAFCASMLINLGKHWHLTNIYAITLLAETLLLLGVGIYTVLAGPEGHGIEITSVLSMTMGIQNAASTRISNNRVRTTHVSGIVTDIGVELALLSRGNGRIVKVQILRNLALHLATIIAFLVGGVVGVVGYAHGGGLIFCGLAVVVFSMCLRYLGKAHD